MDSDAVRSLTGSVAADYDCRRCGACCLSTTKGGGYVIVTPDEADRLRRLALPIITDDAGELRLGSQRYDGPGSDAACVGFEGAPRFPCTCTIYDHRPTRCREFEMGSHACRLARLRAGLPI
jgi:Fe-S-cluster containining protein